VTTEGRPTLTPTDIATRADGHNRLTITFDGRTVGANIRLGSANGWSLALEFEAVLGGYVGMLPLLWDGSESYREILGPENRACELRWP
jgi:hypothetical protein